MLLSWYGDSERSAPHQQPTFGTHQHRSIPLLARAGYVFRAKLILMLAQGASFSMIKRQLQTTAPTIIRWKQRFLESGLDGLTPITPARRPRC